MNIEKWIECIQQNGVPESEMVIAVSDFRALIETHAIVPRDMPYETLAKIKSETPATVRKMLNIFIEESERDDGCDI